MHTRASATALRYGALLSLGLSACFTAPAGDQAKSEETGQSREAITNFAVQLALPTGTFVGDATVAASGAINAGDRDQIGGEMTSAAGPIALGNDATFGQVVSGGNVVLHDRTTASSIVAAGTVTQGNSDHLGSSTAHASVPTSTVSWTVTPPATSNGDIRLQPDGQAAPAPGAYGALVANSRSNVLLQAGTYFFSSIDLEPQATLFVDSSQGPVIVYVTGAVTYRGTIQSTTEGLPRLFIGYLGTAPVTLSAPFTGVFFAPSADVNVNPGNSLPNRATIYGKTVTLQPTVLIQPMPFDFTVFGVPANPTATGPRPTIFGPKPAVTLTSNLPSDATGNHTATANPGTPTVFTLPPTFPVTGGDIANGTVSIQFTPPGGAVVTCTYQGGSSSATPSSNADFEAGRILHFVSCSNGATAGSSQVGTSFTLTVNQTSSLPVTVSLPFDQNACGHEFDILSATDTFNMRTSFDWSQHQTQVQQNNPDGTPALYYAWVYVETREQLLQLRKLYVDVLSRPLFDTELAQFGGQCGTFRNPGDGNGIFVPVVMPGLVYNTLLQVQTAQNISGNRFPFDAVIIRSDVPAGAKNPNGSISYTALRNGNYHYLNAQVGQPLPTQDQITLDGHDISAALTDAFTFVADAVQDIGRVVTNALGAITGLFTGTVNMDLRILALNVDPEFNDTMPLTRGWGANQGNPIVVPGMRVTLLERLAGFIPLTFTDNTGSDGKVFIQAAKETVRGSGICIDLDNDAARISDFLTANDVCDFRGYSVASGSPPPAGTGGVQLNFGADQSLDIAIADGDMTEMFQSDDVHRYLSTVVGHNTKRARVLMGYWADTFSKSNSDGTRKRAFTPCLNFQNTLSDAIVGAATTADFVASLAFPPLALAAPIVTVVSSILVNSDIIMPNNSDIQDTREVGSHEYGHYSLCSMMEEENSNAVDNLIFDTIYNSGADTSAPVRYINEGWADYISGQTTSTANYRWLNGTYNNVGKTCTNNGSPCYDQNRTGSDGAGSDFGTSQIARVSTLIHDVFDGQPGARAQNQPGNADAWTFSGPSNATPLIYSAAGYGDTKDEPVALTGANIRTLAHHIADGLNPVGIPPNVDDNKLYGAINQTMVDNGVNYCSRCQVFALHSSQGTNPPTNLNDQLTACLNDSLIANALGPAQPSTCSVCPPDVVIDGNNGLTQQTFDVTVHAANDICPDLFVLEVDNPQAFVTDGATGVNFSMIAPTTQAACDTSHTITERQQQADGSFPIVNTDTETGVFNACDGGGLCIAPCGNIPSFSFSPSTVPTSNVQFTTPNVPGINVSFSAIHITPPV